MGGNQRRVPAEPVKIDDVRVRTVDSGLMFQYRTQRPSADCKAQAEELPKVRDLMVKARLTDSHVQRVILFPEDPSHQSVSFEFTRSASGWSTAAPCPITILQR
jgi:hypothetical protein